jgi:hypothetical protein
MFNTILREAGFPLTKVLLIRHKDKRATKGYTPYDLWHKKNHREFDIYQSTQRIKNRKVFAAQYWAVFLGTPSPDNETMFVGVYSNCLKNRKLLEKDQKNPAIPKGPPDKAGTRDVYDLALEPALGDLIGRLFIDWGLAPDAWKQHAHLQDKPITELRPKSAKIVRRAKKSRSKAKR